MSKQSISLMHSLPRCLLMYFLFVSMFVWLKTKHGKFIYTILHCSYILCTYTTKDISMLRSELGTWQVEARQVVH